MVINSEVRLPVDKALKDIKHYIKSDFTDEEEQKLYDILLELGFTARYGDEE